MSGRGKRALFRLAEWLGPTLLRLIHATLRVRVRPSAQAIEDRGPRREPVLYAIWHQTQAILAWTERHRDLGILISEHADGEYIARIVGRLGFRPIRGSTTRGGGRALKQIVREARAGRSIAITPDGPRGPRFRIQPGLILAASLSGRPIQTAAVAIRGAKRLRSWDRFLVPRPFADVLLLYGPKLRVPPDLDAEGRAAERLRVERVMRDLTARAWRIVRRGRGIG